MNQQFFEIFSTANARDQPIPKTAFVDVISTCIGAILLPVVTQAPCFEFLTLIFNKAIRLCAAY